MGYIGPFDHFLLRLSIYARLEENSAQTMQVYVQFVETEIPGSEQARKKLVVDFDHDATALRRSRGSGLLSARLGLQDRSTGFGSGKDIAKVRYVVEKSTEVALYITF